MSIISEPNRRLNPGADNSESIFQTNEIKLVSDVITVYGNYPTTGIYSEEEISGWEWSKSFPQDLNKRQKRINSRLNVNISSYEEGSKLNNWQGCVFGGIELNSIENEDAGVRTKWVPKYSTGEYSIYHKSKRLYSDYSSCKVLIDEVQGEIYTDDETGEEVIIEEELNLIDGIIKNESINIFKRDKRFVNFPFYKYEFDPNLEKENSYDYEIFTEEDAEGNEINLTKINLNTLKKIKVGGKAESLYGINQNNLDVLNTWEYVGKGNENRSVIYTEYFPVISGSLSLIEVTPENVLLEWEEVEEFTFSEKREFILDKVSGIITINSINDLIVRKAKNVEEIENLYAKINFYEEIPEIKNKNGFILIGETRIEYFDFCKESILVRQDALLNLNLEEIEITFLKEGKNFSLGSDIYISYVAAPRIDYEIVDNQNLLRSDKTIDLKPYQIAESEGLIEINPYEKHLDRINLSSDLEEGEFLEMGLESLKIKAELFNSGNSKVKEIKTIFYCDYGEFNNGIKEYTSISNKDGEAFSYYNWSYNEKDSYSWISGLGNTIHENLSTKILIDKNSISNIGIIDAVIFQTLKIDPFYGYEGKEYTIESIDNRQSNGTSFVIKTVEEIENYESYIGNQMMHLENEMQESEYLCEGATNNHSFGYLLHNGRSYKFIITEVLNNKTIVTKKGFFEEFQSNYHGLKIKIFTPKESSWDPQKREERGLSFDRLLYVDNGEEYIKPLKPISVTSNSNNQLELLYENVLLPKSDENDPKTSVAGYKMFLNRKANIWAEAVDPASGRVIRSNTLTINVTLPNFLKSESGFTFRNDLESVEGSAIGGANYLQLEEQFEELEFEQELILYNPFRNGINIMFDNTEE